MDPKRIDRSFCAGYLDGYDAGIDAFALLLPAPDMTAGRAMKRAEEHLLYQLEPWLDAKTGIVEPPAFVPDPARAFSSDLTVMASRIERILPSYRRGYLDGWDAVIQAMAVMLIGCRVSTNEALQMARDHRESCLRHWVQREEAGAQEAPPALEHHARCDDAAVGHGAAAHHAMA